MENWKEIVDDYNLGLEKRNNKNAIMRFVAFENLESKEWFFIDTENNATLTIPFGEVAITMLNTFITMDPDNAHNEKYFSRYKTAGINPDCFKSNFDACKNQFGKLYSFIENLAEFKQKTEAAEFKKAIIDVWHTFRDCNQFTLFADMASLFDSNCNSAHEEAVDTLKVISRIVEKKICVYHDIVTFTTENNETAIGRAFLLRDIDNWTGVVRWDLLHILNGTAPTPHRCSRCGQFYTSNKNTSKYCEDCGKERNNILNENRKNNSCRYMHKRILDKLGSASNYTGVDKNAFRIESNYYWAVVRGVAPAETPTVFDNNIKTEQQYHEWLENILPNPYTALNNRY